MNNHYLLFDLDNTLYSAELGFFKLIDANINNYMKEKLHIDTTLIETKRLVYFKKFGTTLKGLQLFYPVDPDDYLEYVHNVNIGAYLKKNIELKKMLDDFDYPKAIFSNGNKEYIKNVLNIIGIQDCFTWIIDIKATDYIPKPYPESFGIALEKLNAKADQCVFIDDMRRNIKTATLMGFKTVWLQNPVIKDTAILFVDSGSIEDGRSKDLANGTDNFRPDFIINNIMQLSTIIDKIWLP